jgi:hypothetical protein
VPSASPGAFAEAVAALFAGDRGEHSRAARRRAEASDWNAVFPNLVGHYRRLVCARRGDAVAEARDAAVTRAPEQEAMRQEAMRR